MDEGQRREAPRWLVRGGSGLAALGGLAWGFVFGNQVAGMLLGAVTALLMALICALLAGAALEKLPLGRRKDRP